MKILRKLTYQNLKKNTSRTLVTIIGILLSAALITVVAGVATSAQQTYINAIIQQNGDYEVLLRGSLTQDDTERLLQHRDIDHIYLKTPVGAAKFDSNSRSRTYVSITGLSEDAMERGFSNKLAQGRYPQNTDEIVLGPQFAKLSKTQYHVGDTITFTVGSLWESGTVTASDIPKEGTKAGDHFVSPEDADSNSELVPEFKKTYTVVGILESTGVPGYGVNVYTLADLSPNAERSAYYQNSDFYLDLAPSAESRYAQVLSEITGLEEQPFKEGALSDNDLKGSRLDLSFVSPNTELLKVKGMGLSIGTTRVFYSLAAILIGIVVLSSVFIIRNSFAISITEKTRLYGMLRSVGATPRQIRHNVLFEGFLLGVIGIPLGIGLGVGVTAFLMLLCNRILGSALGGELFAFSVPWQAIVAAAVLSALTIFCSTYATARRAGRISPIEAIRSNRDINVSGNSEKSYRTPKLIRKLFGVGGDIAWKNLKRSRKKYRTTVISIVVSVAIFLSISSFVQYGVNYSQSYFQEMEYNMMLSVQVSPGDLDRYEALFDEVSGMSSVMKSSRDFYSDTVSFQIPADQLPADVRDLETQLYNGSDPAKDGTVEATLRIAMLPDDVYRELIGRLGYSYDEVKDKGLLQNSNVVESDSILPRANVKLLDSVKDTVLNGTIYGSGSGETKVSLTLAGELEKSVVEAYDVTTLSSPGTILVSAEWFREHLSGAGCAGFMQLDSDNADELETAVENLDTDLTIINLDREARDTQSLTLIMQIFVYGFILVISLIGLTNIFNTITTNMRMRRREFAMLRSVGMTNREFYRMIRLESLFYTVRALLLGIPIGLLGGWLVHLAVNQNGVFPYIFPWQAILISIAAVLIVVWVIMRFSIGKVRKQNLIETIRNENY